MKESVFLPRRHVGTSYARWSLTFAIVFSVVMVVCPIATGNGTSSSASCVALPTGVPVTDALGWLQVPVAGVASNQLRDTFADRRDSARIHEALDIPAPYGTPALAATAGKIVKLFWSTKGGMTVYQKDVTGTFVLYYAHLLGYTADLHEGQAVQAGEVLGYVGATGNASPDTPHLHFAVWQVCDPQQIWYGIPINPYPLLQPPS